MLALWINILIPFVAAAFTVWLTLRLRDRLSVKLASTLNDRQFADLVALYLDRVPDYERVPPDHFKAFLETEYSATSRRCFRRLVNKNTIPVHLLLVARTSHGICGFVKAIFVPNVQCLFIAYVVTAKGNTHEERSVAEKLLSALLHICRGCAIKSLVCEICIDSASCRHEAKARLFRHYARAHGLHFMLVDARYVQPEICSFDAGECATTDAHLYIAPLARKRQDESQKIPRHEYEQLVAGIYKHVYLMSYAMAEPELTERYRVFLETVTTSAFKSLESNDISLR
jgi:hypothetical protein